MDIISGNEEKIKAQNKYKERIFGQDEKIASFIVKNLKSLFLLYMAKSDKKKTVHIIRQRHKEQDVQCVASEFNWKSDRIVLIISGRQILKSRIFGCTDAAKIQAVSITAGAGCLIISEFLGKMMHLHSLLSRR